MGLPKRKPTRLKGYDYSTPGAYFITICTQNREHLFQMENVGNDLCVVPPEQNRIIHKWLKETENPYIELSVGMIIFGILKLIPIIGVITYVLFFFFGLGLVPKYLAKRTK